MTSKTVAELRAAYEAIAAANLILPATTESDFELMWMTLELIYRDVYGITGTEAPAAGETIDERITALQALITAAKVYDQAGYVISTPTAGARLFLFIANRYTNYGADFAGSYAKCATTATAEAVFTIKKNGDTIGTITFSAGVTAGVFASTGSAVYSLAPGDILEVVAPSPQDATLADVCWNLKALFSD